MGVEPKDYVSQAEIDQKKILAAVETRSVAQRQLEVLERIEKVLTQIEHNTRKKPLDKHSTGPR